MTVDEVEFHFDFLSYSVYKADGSGNLYGQVEIDKAIEFTGIDYRIAYTGAWKDMGIFFDKTEEELREEYPYDAYISNKFQVVHLYEKG